MRPKIVIVGAGICGLTTAITVGEGVNAVPDKYRIRPETLFLDAGARAGGRAQTHILSNGLEVDVGPHWFHGGTKNPFFRWAMERYRLGRLSIDHAKRRVVVSADGGMSAERREWANIRLFQLYSEWKARHPDRDISLASLAALANAPDIKRLAEERARNWMAVDNAQQVSSDEYFGDDAGSGGVQLEGGIAHLIDRMVEDAQYYQAQIKLDTIVTDVASRSGGGFVVTDSKGRVYEADGLVVTASVGALKGGIINFDDKVNKKLNPVLAGMTAARMTKVFVPLREDYFESMGIAPDTFVTIYDRRHAWLCHMATDGKPVVTIFACGDMSELVESGHRRDIEDQMLNLLETHVPQLAGCSAHVDGRIHMTGWTTNAYFRGAYSAMLPGHKRINPLHCGPIFAGEAFVKNLKKSPSQMTGAWESARITGKALLKKLGSLEV
jgi:predicted NAD/FAD-dependent oxidoreductase